ncbi:ABC transporter permease [Streptomyces ferrugineus]|uniref:ABC transporter permease n=1 Tax=Streptomyces ferrugineus TaxID=1413221 RepID=A0A7M2SW79_9ACTN|nr:ABC transporter permease [Streptomyces ferrugineus]QOV39915.1 ABC transporter permease [Streptomyces ferrugineus]
MSSPSATPTRAPARRRLIAVVVLVPVIAALALWAFAWPAARTAPRDLPLGVAGPAAATAQVERQLAQKDGAFEIHRYADEAAAREAVEDRTVYGAVVVTPQGPELLTASAASPTVAQLLQQAVAEQAAAEGTQVRTVDVVPAPENDPRGAALNASVLPLALAGIAAGAAVTLLGLRGMRAVSALVGVAALIGVIAAALAHSWLGVLTGDWWAEAGVLALATLAVSAAVAGLAALIGTAGVGIVAGAVMLFGNPFSGAPSAPQMLPEPVGVIGQWLPPGAGTTLLRSVSFFDGAAATGPALTLTWWAALGLGAVLLGSALKARKASAERAPERELATVG